MTSQLHIEYILSTLVYGILGFVLFLVSLWAMEKLTPFSLKKKITEEGNIALAIVVAAIIIALGLIYSSAIQ